MQTLTVNQVSDMIAEREDEIRNDSLDGYYNDDDNEELDIEELDLDMEEEDND